MNRNKHAERSAPKARAWRKAGLICALSCTWLSCSVYDHSLLEGSEALRGGGSSVEAGSAGSNSAGSAPAGGSGGAAQGSSGTLGRAGEPGASGSSDGGGVGSSGSLGGSVSSGGSVNAGSANSGGSVSAGGVSAGGDVSASGGTSVAGSTAGGGSGSAGALIELARGKSATASSQQAGNDPAKGNDNDTLTRWCAINGSFPQWWRVDLGAVHRVSQVAVQFEQTERRYDYQIQTSLDDAAFVTQLTSYGTGAVQTVTLPSNPQARYLRIAVTNAAAAVDSNGTTHATWACFWEIAVLGS